jgi:hypothetical protein
MNQQIEDFVRQSLGCNCPQEVFEYIDCQSAVKIDENTILDYEINIGNRLLIFAAGIDKTDSMQTFISKLVKAGTKKRNEMKFNRLRIVLLTTRINDIDEQAHEIFNSIITDEKIHLHIIDKNNFPLNSNSKKAQ